MEIVIEKPVSRVKKALAFLIVAGVTTGSLGLGITAKKQVQADFIPQPAFQLATIQENSLLTISSPSEPIKVQKINMVITAYSSTTWETDDTPFITASGAYVEDGVVANNMLPFGTKIRIPELYGDKIFVVKDRMHSRKGYYHLDIWFPNSQQAKDFGAKETYIEVLGN